MANPNINVKVSILLFPADRTLSRFALGEWRKGHQDCMDGLLPQKDKDCRSYRDGYNSCRDGDEVRVEFRVNGKLIDSIQGSITKKAVRESHVTITDKKLLERTTNFFDEAHYG